MTNILSILHRDGIEAKKKTAKEYSSPCPFCGGDDRFNIWPEEGNWWCRQCGEKGDQIDYLRKAKGISYVEACKELGSEPKDSGRRINIGRVFEPEKKTSLPAQSKAEEYANDLHGQPDAIEYLKSRGITARTCNRFKIGFAVWRNRRCITIPHFQGGKLINIKYRNIDPNCKKSERFDSEKNAKRIFFNADSIPLHEDIIIAEGEIDAISLIQAGMENVIGVTCGATDSLEPHQIDELSKTKKITICFDPDDAGQAGAKAIARRLGYKRCFNASMPAGYDTNDFFQRFTAEDFKPIISGANPFEIPGIISTDHAIESILSEMAGKKQDIGLQTQWPSVNKRIKGFMPGDLIIVTAPPKIGKTSWCLDISRHLAIQDIPVLFYCLEMRPDRIITKLLQSYYRSEQLSQENVRNAQKALRGLPLYYAHSFRKEKLEDILEVIRQAIMRYDLRLVVFDNLHFVCRSLLNVNEEVANAIQGFKLLAEEMEIPIIVIAQPRKRETGGADDMMTADDVKYSNAIHADCDQMIILHRKRTVNDSLEGKESSYSPTTWVRIEAHRYGSGGGAKLFFHGEYSRFDEISIQQA